MAKHFEVWLAIWQIWLAAKKKLQDALSIEISHYTDNIVTIAIL